MSRSDADIEAMKLFVRSPKAFTKAFFDIPGYFEGKGIPSFLDKVYAVLAERHPKTAIFLPRDHLKTTAITKTYALHEALVTPQYCRFISATDGLMKNISYGHAAQLESNHKLRYYFGDQVGEVWQEKRRVLKNGAILEYGSAGSKGDKGKTSELGRPKLTILDDVETTEVQDSPAMKEQLLRWMYSDLLPSIPFDVGGRLVYIATVSGKDSIAQAIIDGKMGDWKVLRLPACDFETGELLWPERFSLEHFEKMRSDFAAANRAHVFNAEILLSPTDPATQPFKQEMIRFCTEHEADQVTNRAYFACIDMAYSKKKTSDHSGIVVGFTDADNELYVTHRKREQLSAEALLDYIFDLHTAHLKKGGITIGVEAHRLWHDHTLPQECKKRGLHPRVVELKHQGVSKADRILSLQTGLKSIQVVNKEETRALVDRLLAWTKRSSDDDDLDALAYLNKIKVSAKRAPKVDPFDAENVHPVSRELHRARLGMSQKKKRFKLAERATTE